MAKKHPVLIFFILLLAVAGIAVVTCPDKQAHKDAIMSVINEKISNELGTSEQGDSDDMGLLYGIASIGSHVSGWFIDSSLSVKNNFVYSVGYLTFGGETKRVSVGVFGHVFTFSKKDLDKATDDAQ